MRVHARFDGLSSGTGKGGNEGSGEQGEGSGWEPPAERVDVDVERNEAVEGERADEGVLRSVFGE